ncbi:uncharacterized protein LOC100576056 [Acyrthosiphon pisum]|uniref:MYND-type domain-containing protein n=1 Tax=Acyrthosiphon pisum TaxID=7029 RepID=A0A8R2A8V5_ACYPI|nr:uncharacterized protein LOC100576056 [Acyrthosiphon pisum]|eukprot:XP_003242888.1 PREDICTED: uncharacterized protein LOC100576056 [Acyrthosiphon pisum]
MHTYTKKYVDGLMKKSMFTEVEVSLMKLTKEDIENFKLSLIKKKDNIPKEEVINDEPAEKKQKLNRNGIDVFKSVLSRESETHKFESQLNSSLKPIKKTAFTNMEEVPTVIDCDESTKSGNSSAKNVWPRINVIDVRKMMEKDKYINWMNTLGIKPKLIKNGNTNLVVAKPSTSKINPSSHSTKVNGLKYPLNDENNVGGNLIEIEKILKKYFGRSVLNTVVVIANIVNIISISNKHLKEQMDEAIKKISEAEKLKVRCDAYRTHEMHKKILETKLKTNFEYIISSFAESEFDLAFKLLFLSILTVLRILDQPKYGKARIFNKLLLTLSTSLKNGEYNHPKMLSIFRSRKLRPECIEIIKIIEDRRDSDPEIVIRMPLFFVSSVDKRQYFQAATDIVTGKLNENLELLIDDAILQCSIDSKCKNVVDSSTVKLSNCKLPVTKTIQSPINCGIITEPTFQFKNLNKLIPALNVNKVRTIGNAGVEPSIETTQRLNNFYNPFSSSPQKEMSESSSSTVMPIQKCTVLTPIISNSPLYLHQTASSSDTATPVPSKRLFLIPNTSIQNIKTEPDSSPHITQGNTIVINKQTYKIGRLPPTRKRSVDVGTHLAGKQPTTDVIKCYMNKCENSAKIMCSNCKIVKYCSLSCQQQHWIIKHIDECDNLRRLNQALP